jgi:acyl-CoA reductase-like NAD-dependent aldehyde dehydrogenase
MYLQSFGANQIQNQESIELRAPHNQKQVIGMMPVCSRKDLDEVVEQAKIAQKTWSDRSVEERVLAIEPFISLIDANLDRLVEVLKTEQGMLDSVVRREVHESISQIKHTLEVGPNELASRHLSDKSFVAEIKKVPHGITAAIVPWNAPISLATAKVIPALLAGNAIIVKPSPRAPHGVTKFLELLRDCLPLGLISVLHGLDELGEAIIRHRDIRKISFTGSTAVGKRVATAAASELKSVQLELGGNDAAVVLPDADIKKTAAQLIDSAFRRSGQFCYATKRVYVHASIKEQMIEALVDSAEELRIGPPADSSATIGPVIDKQAQQRLNKLIEAAEAAGATVHPCGTVLESADLVNGCYVQPTLVWDIDHAHTLVTEEQFGPVLPILEYESLPELVEELNGQDYGLSGSVWGSNLTELKTIASQLQTGRVFINAARAMGQFAGELPAGGHKHSGLGWEKSVFGLREYYQYQTINGPIR